MPPPEREPVTRTWERHWQSLSGVAIIGLLGWNLMSTHQSAVQLAELRAELAAVTDRIADLSMRSANRYDADDAAKDLRVRDQILRDHSDRLREIERRLPGVQPPTRHNRPGD